MRTAKRSGLLRAPRSVLIAAAYACAALSAAGARAEIVISSQSTQNMSCSNGVCAPTAKNAVLNTGDLEALLASGNVTVTTTGSGVEADNIAVKSSVSWATANSLALTAHRSVAIDAPVSVVGLSSLSLQTGGASGQLTFAGKGSVGFSNLASQLTINGMAYTLAGNITTLAAHIAANPAGAYALAGTYDASTDGTYNASPIATVFTGTFEGLGNAILNFSIDGVKIGRDQGEGFFDWIGAKGTVRDFGLVKATMQAVREGKTGLGAGALTAYNEGTVHACYVTGNVTVVPAHNHTEPYVGGLVGANSGVVEHSHSAANVTGTRLTRVGGLAASNGGTISESYATGAVSGGLVGGLVAENYGTIQDSFATGNVDVLFRPVYAEYGGGLADSNRGTVNNSYATGTVTAKGSGKASVGGLLGTNQGSIAFSYSTGAVTAGNGSYVGGLIGADAGTNDDNDWDTDKSGITNLSQGAGNIPNDPGITGLSTAQFQSGLPPGFDPKIWAEKPNINGGLPYLLANPPQ